jgi:hypothetical protein
MDDTDHDTGTWRGLRQRAATGFSARAGGLFSNEFALSASGMELGRLRRRGASGAVFESGGLRAEISREGAGKYRMLIDGEEPLFARGRRFAGVTRLERGGRSYEVRRDLLRNTAEARLGGSEIAKLRGNLTGRRYRAELALDNEDAVFAAIFLLYHLAELRRRALPAGRG